MKTPDRKERRDPSFVKEAEAAEPLLKKVCFWREMVGKAIEEAIFEVRECVQCEEEEEEEEGMRRISGR
jgi:hypothetical protein